MDPGAPRASSGATSTRTGIASWSDWTGKGWSSRPSIPWGNAPGGPTGHDVSQPFRLTGDATVVYNPGAQNNVVLMAGVFNDVGTHTLHHQIRLLAYDTIAYRDSSGQCQIQIPGGNE